MRLHSISIQNYRRLRNVHIDIDPRVSIFVGANNSGKTAATHLLAQFLGGRDEQEPFTIYDFHARSWDHFNGLGTRALRGEDVLHEPFPHILLDLWLKVDDRDLHRVVDLLPNLRWQSGQALGVRLSYEPVNAGRLIDEFQKAYQNAERISPAPVPENEMSLAGKPVKYRPWPQNMCEFLSRRLGTVYTTRQYVCANGEWLPLYDSETGRDGSGRKRLLSKLIKVDILNAQRHLTDRDSPHGSMRSESLSKRFSRAYRRQASEHDANHEAMSSLHDSGQHLDKFFTQIFDPTLKALQKMGTGHNSLDGPNLEIRPTLRPENILTENAEVHYVLAPDAPLTLPDRYNGLGFKNMMYMTMELLECQEAWLVGADDDDIVPLLHLVVIEEPEAHLHVQLQQVFIRQAFEVLNYPMEEHQDEGLSHQLMITTHSPHILYEKGTGDTGDNQESGFSTIRYFRRHEPEGEPPYSEVLNLSKFDQPVPDAADEEEKKRAKNNRFLMKYMKLTHCDLFFADAAILVEGNVERLLLPLMVKKAAPNLLQRHLSLLEVGGAFAHCFQELIKFLGLTTLIITDLDSVAIPEDDPNVKDETKKKKKKRPSTCSTWTPGANTSNPTLIQWLPGIKEIDALLEAEKEQKIDSDGGGSASVRVAYQIKRSVTWNNETREIAGRTLEEMFALENLAWCQASDRKSLQLRVVDDESESLEEVTNSLYERVKSSSFDKTRFALQLITEESSSWQVPFYIAEGLEWLEKQLDAANSASGDTP